jgi:hypothetical protein
VGGARGFCMLRRRRRGALVRCFDGTVSLADGSFGAINAGRPPHSLTERDIFCGDHYTINARPRREGKSWKAPSLLARQLTSGPVVCLPAANVRCQSWTTCRWPKVFAVVRLMTARDQVRANGQLAAVAKRRVRPNRRRPRIPAPASGTGTTAVPAVNAMI